MKLTETFILEHVSYAYKDYPAIIKRAGLSRVKGA